MLIPVEMSGQYLAWGVRAKEHEEMAGKGNWPGECRYLGFSNQINQSIPPYYSGRGPHILVWGIHGIRRSALSHSSKRLKTLNSLRIGGDPFGVDASCFGNSVHEHFWEPDSR